MTEDFWPRTCVGRPSELLIFSVVRGHMRVGGMLRILAGWGWDGIIRSGKTELGWGLWVRVLIALLVAGMGFGSYGRWHRVT